MSKSYFSFRFLSFYRTINLYMIRVLFQEEIVRARHAVVHGFAWTYVRACVYLSVFVCGVGEGELNIRSHVFKIKVQS